MKLSVIIVVIILLSGCSKSELEICISTETSKSLSRTGMTEAFQKVRQETIDFWEANPQGLNNKEEIKTARRYSSLIEAYTSKILIKDKDSELYQFIEQELPKSEWDYQAGLIPAPYDSLFNTLYRRAGSIAQEEFRDSLREDPSGVFNKFRIRAENLAIDFIQISVNFIEKGKANELCNRRGIYK